MSYSMKSVLNRFLISLSLVLSSHLSVTGASTLRIDAAERHQRITGFGGFVCSPTFGYNHMTTEEIKKVWGESSTLGCNIVRLYLPIGRSYWSQSLNTAKQLKQMGLIVFASPWGQPAEWKTNNSSNAVQDELVGYLKEENYADYAQYLNDYVDYLAENGVKLDAISMQNEPDMRCTYAGCIWTPEQIAKFVKTYGASMHCPLIAAESVGFSDSYANALLADDVIDGVGIYGAHQYGGLQSAFKKMADKGKEIWMTEYLINWNEIENTTRNFNWEIDGFNFARAINLCMMNDVNAWVHYATKRYYAMIGDGQNGTTSGAITKRGYVLGQYAKYITGFTRVGHSFKDAEGLEGSAYLSQTGDTVVAVVINSSDKKMDLKVDLPFFTTRGRLVVTSKSQNMRFTSISLDTPTFRPTVSIPASSVSTIRFVKDSDRPASAMTGKRINYEMIEHQTPSNSAFGTAYQLSNKTVTFDHSHPLISGNTTAAKGQLTLNGDYDRLVIHVNSVSSTLSYTSAKTTLYYVNANGRVASYDYGTLDLSANQDFDLVLDLSRKTLTDGCKALIGLTNNNWSSVLTLSLGDVYLQSSNGWGYAFGGSYSPYDSNLLDCQENSCCTWMDMTGVEGLGGESNPLEGAANDNCLLLVAEDSPLLTPNTIRGNCCDQLRLTADGGGFHTPILFTASKATLTVTVDGARMIVLPFEAELPQGVTVYQLEDNGISLQAIPVTSGTIAAAQPILVEGQGSITFTGQGEVTTDLTIGESCWHRIFEQQNYYEGDYLLRQQDGRWGFERQTTDGILNPFDVRFIPSPTVSASFLPIQGTTALSTIQNDRASEVSVPYLIDGTRAGNHSKLKIINKKKIIRHD